ncbi:MAG: class I SAM-dependent methyltransferase [Bacteroidales bacterium]
MKLEINCPVCNYSDFSFALETKSTLDNKVFKIYTCNNCVLSITTPLLKPDELTSYYKNYYTEIETGGFISFKERLKIIMYRGLATKNKFLQSFFFALIKNSMQVWLPQPFGNKRVLDVGCGWGRLLDYFKILGWETFGVEPGISASERARKKGHTIYTGELLNTKFPSNYFSAVIFCHSLEHIHNPMEVLEETHRILAPHGLLVIEVPNFRSADASFWGSTWNHLDVPYHLYHWTPQSLKEALLKSGFKILNVRFKILRVGDFKTNMKKSVQNQRIYYVNVCAHFLFTWLLGHLGIRKDWYGHFMVFYATK